MSAALHLAGPEDLDKLMTLVAAFHAEDGIDSDADSRQAGIAPLLTGSPYGAVYLIGPTRAPVGYVVVTFGWSVEFGGLDAFIDEFYIRPGVRGRGMGTDVLTALPNALAQAGVKAVHLEVDRGNDTAQRLYMRAGFDRRDRYMLMSRKL
jgi:ribosomal protein S18 acetylase RimI-like enzyme